MKPNDLTECRSDLVTAVDDPTKLMKRFAAELAGRMWQITQSLQDIEKAEPTTRSKLLETVTDGAWGTLHETLLRLRTTLDTLKKHQGLELSDSRNVIDRSISFSEAMLKFASELEQQTHGGGVSDLSNGRRD